VVQVVAAGLRRGYPNYVGIISSFRVPLYILLQIYSLYRIVWAPADLALRRCGAARAAAG